MNVEAIKEAIQSLSEPEQVQLGHWFAELRERAWDEEMEKDFSPGGRGMHLVEKVKADIAAGKFRPIEEFCEERRQSRK